MSNHEQSNDDRPRHIERGGILIDKPKSDEEIARETRESEDREFKRDQVKTNRRLTWFTLFLVLGTFGGLAATIWQSSISQESADTSEKSVLLAQKSERNSVRANALALKQSEDNFVLDERPVVWLTPKKDGAPELDGIEFDQVNPTKPSSGQVVWQWHFMNYGRSPANNILFHSFIKVGDRPEEPTYRAKKHKGSGGPMPPGKIDFAATISSPLERAEFDSAARAGKITIRGIITYSDISGHKYETDFCQKLLPTMAILYCENRNSIK